MAQKTIECKPIKETNVSEKHMTEYRGEWRVHTPNLLKEVLSNESAAILSVPLNVFGKLLAAVGDRAAEINDPELNKLMVRLTIYSQADPASPDYDPEAVEAAMSL